MTRRARNIVMTVLGLLLIGYCVLLVTLYLTQRRLMYQPDRARTAPASVGLAGVDERTIETPDGERLVAWYGAARPGQPTLLYFHGNAWGLADRAPRIERFMAQGYGVYMMSYRSFSGSTGQPTEAANRADALLAYEALRREGVAAGSIIAYGESLGTHMAVRVALAKPLAGLILDSPYTSIVDVAQRRFPMFPVRRFAKDRYDTAAVIGQLQVPLLIIHGARDRVVPVDMGRELARLAPEPKRYVEFPSGGHTDLYVNGNNALASVTEFVSRVLDAAHGPAAPGRVAP